MTVRELIAILQTMDPDAPVCFNDRGIFRDARDPVPAESMNGPCILLDYGTYNSKGYIINYSKRYGYEMVLNDCINDRLQNLPDVVYDELQRTLYGINCELNDECVELGNDFPPMAETIGPRCQRDVPNGVTALAEKVMDTIRNTLQ